MAKTKVPRPDDYPPSIATKRMEAALRAALSMPRIDHAKKLPTQVKKVSKKTKRTPT